MKTRISATVAAFVLCSPALLLSTGGSQVLAGRPVAAAPVILQSGDYGGDGVLGDDQGGYQTDSAESVNETSNPPTIDLILRMAADSPQYVLHA